MKILLSSHFFHPSVGGIEAVSGILAKEFAAAGHEVRVVTTTAEDDARIFPFQVYRRPKCATLLKLVRWCDVYLQNNISLRSAWPLLLARRPWVIAHHTWIARTDGSIAVRDRVKQGVLSKARNIAVSRAVEQSVGVTCTIIGNPYDDALFRTLANQCRDRELIFVGRLVSDKGVDLLLDALSELRMAGTRPRLTIAGEGPEEPALRARVLQLDLQSQVYFAGAQRPETLATLLNRHRIIVIPSRWSEPFGIVALEGIACGCVPVGAECGGLSEAIGPCGVLFEHNNVRSLASALGRLLADDADLDRFRRAADDHLASHTVRRVAAQYLDILEEAAHQ